MTEVEETISMNVGLGHVKIGSDERNEQRIEEVVEEFVEYLPSFFEVGLSKVVARNVGIPQPVDAVNLC